MCGKWVFLTTLVLMLGSINSGSAVVWTNTTTNGDWCDPCNWDTGSVPTAADVAEIDPPVAGPIVDCDAVAFEVRGPVSSTPGVQEMAIIGGSLTINDDWQWGSDPGTAIINISGGPTITIGSEWRWGGGSSSSTANINISGNPTVSIGSRWRGVDHGTGIINITENSFITVADSWRVGDDGDAWVEITVSGNPIITTGGYFMLGDDGSGLIDISGGTIDIGGDWKMSCRKGAVIMMTMSGGSITCAGDMRVPAATFDPGTCTLNMYDGTIDIDGHMEIGGPAGSTGHVYLCGGVIHTNTFGMRTGGGTAGTMEICCDSGGVLIINGNVVTQINQYVDNGWIYCDDPTCCVQVVWDSVLNETRVTCVHAALCYRCRRVRVSQESSPGEGDFDDHILGCIEVFKTTDSAADYYSYDSPHPTSFGNSGFISQHGLPPDRSHLFLVSGNDGLSLFTVHDRPSGLGAPLDQDGGRAEMRFDLLGDPDGATRTVEDDPTDTYIASATTFSFKQVWSQCCTDGQAITGLDGDWSMLVQFTQYPGSTTPVIEGLDSWFADSNDGSTIELALEKGRRVRLDCNCPVKWSQPPVPVYIGWDEESHELLPRMVADDFLCDSNQPVGLIRWWGSFVGWAEREVPLTDLPSAFYITIWDDVAAGVDANYSHPGQIIWDNNCTSYDVQFQGWEFDPRICRMGQAKFRFEQVLDPNDYWYQPDDDGIYWLGIMALYDGNLAPEHLWGWETREHYFQDDAVRINADPRLGGWPFPPGIFEPIEFDSNSWDLDFELLAPPAEPDPKAELGDAPDSTTNSSSVTMTAYSWWGGVVANFPTVYQTGSPPYGPIHNHPLAVAYLGPNTTLELEADTGWDSDLVNNINPGTDTPDQDGADDGILGMPLNLPRCRWTQFDYQVNLVDPSCVSQCSLYVNAWFDWNRDGDWDDTLTCKERSVPEWAVQNQVLCNLSPGLNTITTPWFMCWRRWKRHIWMRITLSEQPWCAGSSPGLIGNGGSGPADGYAFGETEDYYFKPQRFWWGSPDLNANGIVNFEDVALLAGDWLEVDPNCMDPNDPDC